MADVFGDVSISTRSRIAFKYEADGGTAEVTDNIGYDGSVAVGDFSSATEFEFLSESLGKVETFAYNGGIRGTRSRNHERVRKTSQIIRGSVEMTPTPVELDTILKLVTGTASTPFVLTELVPTFNVIVDRTGNRFMYTGCKIGRFSIRGSQGGLISSTIDIEGKQEFVTSGAFPSLTIDDKEPYVFSEAVFSYSGSSYEVMDFEFVLDNGLITDRQMNSVYRKRIPSGDRQVGLRMTVPYSSNTLSAFGNIDESGIDGATLTLTNGAVSLTMTFGNLKNENASPVSGSRGNEIMLPLSFAAYKKGSTMEVSFANDSTYV
jgi:uncharacterized protein (DUF2164 family)